MDAYIYAADLYCADCGEDIRSRLTQEGKAPSDPDDETSYDSDEFPKGPFADGGGEADCPQHCGGCGAFLENPLTSDGVDYVTKAGVEPDISDTVREWGRFYGIHVDTPEDKTNRARFDAMRLENGKLPAFAFPGGYPIVYLFGDNRVCCPGCANGENGSEASASHEESMWRLAGWFVHYEGEPEICSHCNSVIESAYGPVESESSSD